MRSTHVVLLWAGIVAAGGMVGVSVDRSEGPAHAGVLVGFGISIFCLLRLVREANRPAPFRMGRRDEGSKHVE